MSTRISKVVAGCFATLRQLRSIHRSLKQATLTSLVVSLVLTRVDYCNAVVTGLPSTQLNRLQSVINDATISLRCSCSLIGCMSLRGLNTSCVYCVSLPTRHGSRIPGQQLPTCVRRLITATSSFNSNSTTDRTRHPLFNTRNRAFPVGAARAWNALPHSVLSAPSVPTFRRLLKTYVFNRSFYS